MKRLIMKAYETSSEIYLVGVLVNTSVTHSISSFTSRSSIYRVNDEYIQLFLYFFFLNEFILISKRTSLYLYGYIFDVVSE